MSAEMMQNPARTGESTLMRSGTAAHALAPLSLVRVILCCSRLPWGIIEEMPVYIDLFYGKTL